ncbi:alpha/beta fold hydrolase [Pseudidiomarina mangrovi]|uniref:alpha/beta fold hydrolase n=1 Tax=Pseudidiomarina mangrovi TaxID=2487133 RepID=UPI001F0C1A29|nr:alpha/beta fold hydrolase [Pseudidiomarina mangrovi]
MSVLVKLAWLLVTVVVTAMVLLVGALIAFWAPDQPLRQLAERWAPAPSQFIDLQGMQVHVRDEGPRADSSSAIPIILLHGTGASLHTWDGWSAALTQQRRVIRVDLPGFGLTGPEPNRDYSMARYAEFVMAVADHYQLSQFHLGGNSLGGRIAWYTAALNPERVQRLVLVDASGGYPLQAESVPLAFKIASNPLFSGLMNYMLPRAVIRSSVENVYGDPSLVTEELVDLYYAMSVRSGNRQALRDRFAQDPLNNPQAVAHEQTLIQGLQQPTLILWGALDRLIPVSHAHQYAADLQHHQLHIFAELGHIPHEEDPAATVAPVLTFLAEETAAHE